MAGTATIAAQRHVASTPLASSTVDGPSSAEAGPAKARPTGIIASEPATS
jgi:hypothetical protein